MHPLLEEKRDAIRAACEQHNVAELHVFGSAVRGDWRADTSDFDFTVRFRPMSPSAHAEAYWGLIDTLEQLLGRPVDVVEVHALDNESLRALIVDERKALYAA